MEGQKSIKSNKGNEKSEIAESSQAREYKYAEQSIEKQSREK